MSYQRTGDFCSIILAGGSGSKMFPLTESYPKCLLNVGNYPLIYYSLKALEIAGFDETLIVVRESWLKKIKTRVDSLKMKIKAEYHAISHLLEPNTATVLVSIRHRIKCDDVFVLSGDIYGQITLQNMAATYRKREATFCAYIQPPISEDSSEKNEKLSLYRFDSNQIAGSYSSSISCDFFAYNPEDERLLICTNEVDVNESFNIPKTLIAEYPTFRIYKNHHDLHVYIIKKSLLDMISSTKSYLFLNFEFRVLSFKTDLVPYLLNRQFSHKNHQPEPPPPDPEDEFELSFPMPQYTHCLREDINNKPIRCCAYVASTKSIAFRVNTISSFFSSNITALKLIPNRSEKLINQSINMIESKEYIIGINSTVDSSTVFHQSVVGTNCKIGVNCKINNSILLNNIKIYDNCEISNSIIGNDVVINEMSQIIKCIIGTAEIIISSSKLNNQTIINSHPTNN